MARNCRVWSSGKLTVATQDLNETLLSQRVFAEKGYSKLDNEEQEHQSCERSFALEISHRRNVFIASTLVIEHACMIPSHLDAESWMLL
jgi:hypothetical protein